MGVVFSASNKKVEILSSFVSTKSPQLPKDIFCVSKFIEIGKKLVCAQVSFRLVQAKHYFQKLVS